MKMTTDLQRRCSEMLKSFADRKNLQVVVEHVVGEGQTKVRFGDDLTCRERVYHIIWDEVANLSEACAYIYADLINVFVLNKGGTCCKNDHDIVKERQNVSFKIKNVIFNNPATIVLWDDGTKTVVKCQGSDTYSKETGLALCIAKKALGNMPNFNNVFKKWIPEEEVPIGETATFTLDVSSFAGGVTSKQSIIDGLAEKIEDAFKKLHRRGVIE